MSLGSVPQEQISSSREKSAESSSHWELGCGCNVTDVHGASVAGEQGTHSSAVGASAGVAVTGEASALNSMVKPGSSSEDMDAMLLFFEKKKEKKKKKKREQ